MWDFDTCIQLHILVTRQSLINYLKMEQISLVGLPEWVIYLYFMYIDYNKYKY